MNDTLLEMLREVRKTKPRVIVAADGMSASGKTTWAEAFTAEHGFSLVHIDDFFPEPGRARFDVALDLERVLNEVLIPFSHGEKIRFIPFSCQTQVHGDEIMIQQNDVLVLEGVYSLHPYLRDMYDIKLFFRIDQEEQKRRLLKRNGPVYLKSFVNEWIPNENRYFDRYKVSEAADIMY